MVLDNLRNFMLTNDTYNKYNTNIIKSDKTSDLPQKLEPVSNVKDTLIKINDYDILFWYYYIIKYDINEYNNNKKSKFQIEKKEKIRNIELMRKDPSILKKLSITKNYYENDLLNEKKITFGTFMALIAYNNLNVYYVKKLTYYDFNFNENNNYVVLYNNADDYKLNYNCNSVTINKIKQLYCLDNNNKNLKAMSSYKLQELIDIAIKLHIDPHNGNKKKTKQCLYEDIKDKLL